MNLPTNEHFILGISILFRCNVYSSVDSFCYFENKCGCDFGHRKWLFRSFSCDFRFFSAKTQNQHQKSKNSTEKS